jgi:probable rRNA maturation factor
MEKTLKEILYPIQVLNRQKRYKIHRNSVISFCTGVLKSLEVPGARSLSVVFVGSAKMRAMNRRYRRKDYATDVLSFSYKGVKLDGVSFLGEIVIAPEIAFNQAIRYRVEPERELRKLLVHGVLHLLGYDHETDQGQMNRIQTKLLRRRVVLDPPSLADFRANS